MSRNPAVGQFRIAPEDAQRVTSAENVCSCVGSVEVYDCGLQYVNSSMSIYHFSTVSCKLRINIIFCDGDEPTAINIYDKSCIPKRLIMLL